MYSYLPKEYLILGLQSKEMIFSSFEENMRLDSDLIDIALNQDIKNVEHIPVCYWNENNLDLLEKLEKDTTFSSKLKLKLHLELPHLNKKLDDKEFLADIIFQLMDEGDNGEEGYFSVLNDFRESGEHPLFFDADYFAEFIERIESLVKNKKNKRTVPAEIFNQLKIITFALISVLKKENPQVANSFLSNFKILNYFVSAELSFHTSFEEAFPQEMLKDSEKMLAFFEFLKYETTRPWEKMTSDELKDVFADTNDKYKDCYVKALIILGASFQYFKIADLPEDILLSPEKFKEVIEEVQKINPETEIICGYAFLDNIKSEIIDNMFKNELLLEILINYVSDSMSYFSDVVRYGVILGGNSSQTERMNYFINILEKVDVEKMSSHVFKSFNDNFASIIIDFNLIESRVAYGTGIYIDITGVSNDDKEQMRKIISHVIKKYKEGINKLSKG